MMVLWFFVVQFPCIVRLTCIPELIIFLGNKSTILTSFIVSVLMCIHISSYVGVVLDRMNHLYKY